MVVLLYIRKLEYTEAGELICEYIGNRYLPEGATHLIAEVVTADETKILSVAIPQNKYPDFGASDMKYSMWWISDVHTDAASILPDSYLNKSLPYIKQVADADGDKFKGMIVNGDMTDFGKKFEFSTLENAFVEHGIDFPIYYNAGNHDIADSPKYGDYSLRYNDARDAIDYRFERLQEDFGLTFDRSDMWSYETYIGGEHHIILAIPYVTTSTTNQLSAAQEKWLEEKICYDEKSGVPTYIYIHNPYSGTVSRSGDLFTSANFGELLKRHPSAVVVTSHIHLELNTDMNTVVMGDATDYGVPFIDTSSLKDTYVNGASGARGSAYGRYVRVYDDKILVRAMYTIDGMWVPRAEYVIPVAGAENQFVGDFAIDSNAVEGTMEVGTVLIATLNGGKIPEGYTVTWYDMTGAELGKGDIYTVVTANASVSAKIVKTADNSYAYDVARYIAPTEDDGDGDGEEGSDGPSVELTGTTTVKYYGEVVNISGSAGVDFAGQEVTIVLAPRATYTDLSTAKYVGNCTVDEEGNYSFKFKAENVSPSDVFLIKVGESTVSANAVVARTNEELVEVTPTLDAENKLSLSIKNMLADTTTSTLIIAIYDANGTLIKAKPVDYSLAFNENFEEQTYLGEAALEGSYVRVYMWTNLLDLVPMSNVDILTIPELSSEATE